MNDAPSGTVLDNRAHCGASLNFAAARAVLLHQHFADARIIGDAFLRYMNRGETGGVRFDFAQLLGRKQAKAAKTVLLTTLEQCMETRDFTGVGGYHHLAADLVRD